MIREPAVAGRFYPSDPRELSKIVHDCVDAGAADGEGHTHGEKTSVIACMVPHAGYVFSGGVAGAVYARVKLPHRVIILGPRHRPPGANLAIQSEGAWQTPLGNLEIDSQMAHAMIAACPLLVEDEVAHRREHSIEVQIPFIQVLVPEGRFVPIAIGTLDFGKLTELGHSLAKVISVSGASVLIVASSDMNHYESDEITRVKDGLAMDQLLALNPCGLWDVVRNNSITMCGVGPAVAALTAAIDLGAKHAELLRYATSGDIFGERERVVGYAGMIFR
jgi:AmmeMemoRadiSam system protein B